MQWRVITQRRAQTTVCSFFAPSISHGFHVFAAFCLLVSFNDFVIQSTLAGSTAMTQGFTIRSIIQPVCREGSREQGPRACSLPGGGGGAPLPPPRTVVSHDVLWGSLPASLPNLAFPIRNPSPVASGFPASGCLGNEICGCALRSRARWRQGPLFSDRGFCRGAAPSDFSQATPQKMAGGHKSGMQAGGTPLSLAWLRLLATHA